MDKIRKEIYTKYNHTCAICSSRGRILHCHEVWDFDDKKRLQKLIGLVALCEDCHNIVHWGRTISELRKRNFSGIYINELTKHFCKVNECTWADFDSHKVKVGAINFTRNQKGNKKWKIDWGLFKPDKVIKTYEEMTK